jgi:hypothetical protein
MILSLTIMHENAGSDPSPALPSPSPLSPRERGEGEGSEGEGTSSKKRRISAVERSGNCGDASSSANKNGGLLRMTARKGFSAASTGIKRSRNHPSEGSQVLRASSAEAR